MCTEILNGSFPVYEGSVLSVNVSTSSGGEYNCIVFNETAYFTATAYLFISPVVENMTASIGGSVNFTCLTSFPTPNSYTWLSASSDGLFEVLMDETDMKLVLNNLSSNEVATTYRCIISANISDIDTNISSNVGE